MNRHTVVYDGACAFCAANVERIRRLDRDQVFECVPRQTPGLEERFPILKEGDFSTGMRVISPEGAVAVGADAVYEIARRLPRYRRVAWIYRVPILHFLFRRAYDWVARNRYRLRGKAACETGACDAERRT